MNAILYLKGGKTKMEKVFQEIKSLISVGESGLEKIGQPMTDLRNPPVLNHRQLPRSRSRLSKCQLLNIGPSVIVHEPKNSPVLVWGRTLQGVHSKRWQWWGFVHLAESPTTGGGGHWQLVSLLLLTSPNQLLLLTLDEWISHCISHQGF